MIKADTQLIAAGATSTTYVYTAVDLKESGRISSLLKDKIGTSGSGNRLILSFALAGLLAVVKPIHQRHGLPVVQTPQGSNHADRV